MSSVTPHYEPERERDDRDAYEMELLDRAIVNDGDPETEREIDRWELYERFPDWGWPT